MNTTNIKTKIIGLLLIIGIVSCKNPKNSTTKDVEKPIISNSNNIVITKNAVDSFLENSNKSLLNFKELQAKMKTKANLNGQSQSFTTNMRWKKGEKIWLSMSIFGIEGARVLITKDTIKIMDKLNSRYIIKPISYLKEKTYVDLSFADIEKILLGQPIMLNTTIAKKNTTSTETIIIAEKDYKTTTTYNSNNNTLKTLDVTSLLYKLALQSTYTNYEKQYDKLFSMDRFLKVNSGPSVFEMTANFQNIEIKDNLEYPFSINPKYKIEQ